MYFKKNQNIIFNTTTNKTQILHYIILQLKFENFKKFRLLKNHSPGENIYKSNTKNMNHITTIIQGDQKVSVHLMLTILSSGVQRIFDHPVHDICVDILESWVGWRNVKKFTHSFIHSFIHPQPDWLQFCLPIPHDIATRTVRFKNYFCYVWHFSGLRINFKTEIHKHQINKRTVLTKHYIAVFFFCRCLTAG